MTRQRLFSWLSAVVLASLGGAILAVPLVLLLRGSLGAGRDGSWTLVIGAGSVVWAVASAAISALWLRWRAGR